MDRNRRRKGFFRLSALASGQAGYSLIELITVIVLAGIGASVIGVSVDQSNQKTRLSNALNRALADIRYAQELAVAHRQSVNITVSTAYGTYDAKWADTGAYVSSSVDGGDMVVTLSQDPYKVTLSSTGLSGALTFDKYGRPIVSGSYLGSVTSIMIINGTAGIYINPAGYTYIH